MTLPKLLQPRKKNEQKYINQLNFFDYLLHDNILLKEETDLEHIGMKAFM